LKIKDKSLNKIETNWIWVKFKLKYYINIKTNIVQYFWFSTSLKYIDYVSNSDSLSWDASNNINLTNYNLI